MIDWKNTMTDIYTASLLPTKTSSADYSVFRHGFGVEASLSLTQSASVVTHDTTRLCWIDVTLWDCLICIGCPEMYLQFGQWPNTGNPQNIVGWLIVFMAYKPL